MRVTLKRVNKVFHYNAVTADNHKVDIDANPQIGGEGKGARPMELVLMGVGGCASIDLGLILEKQRQILEDYSVEVSAERHDNTAKNFKSINLHFVFKGEISEPKVKLAIDLTLNKYCSVLLSLDNTITITSSYTIN